MIVHLDTSVLIEALVPRSAMADALRTLAQSGDKPTFSTLVLYEWVRGPRTSEELRLRTVLFPDVQLAPFGPVEARVAAGLYREVSRPRGREADLAIAACAIEHGAALWTLNERDFAGLPGLRLYRAASQGQSSRSSSRPLRQA